MKYCLPFVFLQLFIISVSAQEIIRPVRLKSGMLTHSMDLLRNQRHLTDSLKPFHYNSRFYTLVQFNKLPDATERQALVQKGINLYDYVSDNTFLAEINEGINFRLLKNNSITGLLTLHADAKISSELIELLQQPVQDPDKLVAVSFYGNIDKPAVIDELRKTGAQIVETTLQPSHVVFVIASLPVVQKIAALPFVAYISSHNTKVEAFNYRSRAIHGVSVLGSLSGRNLQGKNVTIGIGDVGDATTHIDFKDRVISKGFTYNADHTVNVAGTIAGGGLIWPKGKGMAPLSKVITDYFYGIIISAPVYANDYNMVLTNNSYGVSGISCGIAGDYNTFSNYVDEQLNNNPTLLHVFAAGNSATDTCSPYIPGFATIVSGFQTAKNVLTVGAINSTEYSIAYFSSRGPIADGRLKPELVASGWAIVTTASNNTYNTVYGTSVSAPTATGILGLLYERYRQLHGGSNPSAALIKAVACNGAEDLGNPGPDYTYGFGNLNGRNSVEALENNTYFTGTVANGGTSTFTIPAVAPGTAKVKVLLYWNDPAAFAGAATALVNDLDLTVTTPDGTLHHPLILDPSPGNVNNTAVEGVDNRNNIEQVVINNPPAGNITLTVKGTAIAKGPQDYVVAYQVTQPAIIVEYPFGNETLVPGEYEYIRWNATDPDTSPFTVEYSLDNGNTWITLYNDVPATSRKWPWSVPATATGAALIRVSRNSTAYRDVSDYNFTILGTPAITLNTTCQGYAGLTWHPVPGATGYDITMYKDGDMQVVGATTDTSYIVPGLNKDSTYWLAVRGVMGTTVGRRCMAQLAAPSGGSCTLPVFYNDVTTDSLTAPKKGRAYTSTQLGAIAPQVHITNLGNIATSGSAMISYQVNGGPPVTETVNLSLAAHAGFTYTFTNAYDFSNPGTYTIKTWINYSNDTLHNDDTLTTIVRHLQNDPVVLNPTYTEGFESATVQTYYDGSMGFDGLDRCDFNSSDNNGRAQTFVSPGVARTGNRAITLDKTTYTGTATADSLITTFNLANYSSTGQVWLSLYAKNNGINVSAPGNKIWIRGSDRDAWVPVYTLPYNMADTGNYRAMPPVNITETLATTSPAQTLSSSFQVKFGEEGFFPAYFSPTNNGYTFDDVTLTFKNDVLGMMQVVDPAAGPCSYGAAEHITVQVKNYSSSTLINIPASYQVNNGTAVTENIPSIAPYATINYTFTQTADLSAVNQFTITAWAHNNADNYSANDTITGPVIHSSPAITSFPYLEGFEGANNGNWYTGGVNSSWQCGVPAGAVIKKAANGNKAWVTSLSGNYNNNEFSYLYSPCFDLSHLTQPVFSFSHVFKQQDNCNCDEHWAEYSTDGQTWKKLGTYSEGANWYTEFDSTWAYLVPLWHVSSYDIPTTGATVRFRIAFHSDATVADEGIGIDDIHIFDKVSIYMGDSIVSGLNKPVSGNNWIDFTSDQGYDPSLKLIVSINPNGQDLGNTEVRVYPKDYPPNDGYQYYVGRNLVIQPTNAPTAPVKVRFYFMDGDIQLIKDATDCSSCLKLANAYAVGITQYSNAPAEEDGSLTNNRSGTYRFITPSQVTVVPYDGGYYAEFEVSNFSEFWLSGSSPDHALPIELGAFTAAPVNNTALLQWLTYTESNTSQFIIERSTDGINYTALGTVAASGNSTTVKNYRFIDEHPVTGKNYYRLKQTDNNGKFSYSPIRILTFVDNDLIITLKPNPVSEGTVYITSTANINRIELHDATGKSVKVITVNSIQTQLPVQHVAKGLYFITIVTERGNKVEKLVIQ